MPEITDNANVIKELVNPLLIQTVLCYKFS